MGMRWCVLLLLIAGAGMPAVAQDIHLLAYDGSKIKIVAEHEKDHLFSGYEMFHGLLGGDSLRSCHGGPCTGWVVDKYPDGRLKHRGYYEDGDLLYYRNFYPNGDLEREFKVIDGGVSLLRTYHFGGMLQSETRYLNGKAVEHHAYHTNGRLRFYEEKHPVHPYYIRVESFRGNGDPINQLYLTDRKKVEYTMKEYHTGGILRSEGPLRYDPLTNNTRRHGVWRIYNEKGKLILQELYLDGVLQLK